jgi:TonB family protein
MEKRTTLVLEDTEKHDQAVKRFQSLCDMHRIPFGGGTNLSDLVHSLKDNRHFAMDFWAMVGDMSAQERGSLSDPEMLEVIVEGSTGLATTALPETEKVSLSNLRDLLAGLDIEAPVLPAPIAEPKDDLTRREEHVEVPAPSHSNGSSTPGRKGDAAEMSAARESISDALLRMERVSRELRDQLVAIDQAKRSGIPSEARDVEKTVAKESIERAEEPAAIRIQEAPAPAVSNKEWGESSLHDTPAPMRPATFVEQPAPRAQKIDQEIASDRVPPSRPVPVKEREVFAPRSIGALSRRGFAHPADADDDPSIAVPLAAYAEANRRTVAFRILAVALLLVVVGAVWFTVNHGYAQPLMSRSRTFVSRQLNLFRQEIHNLTAGTSTPKPATQPEPPATHQASPTPQQQTEAPQSTPPQAASPQTPSPQAASPQPVPQNTPPPASTSPQAAAPVAREQPAPLDEGNAIRVPSSVMEENLLVSRVPIYPSNARAMRLEGTVTVETVISESGDVLGARAISGDPRLRAAAEEAVTKWRYKPYTLNGRAVEVVTSVRVGFRLR